MTINSQLVSLVQRLCVGRDLPDVEQVYRPSENRPEGQDKKFGVVMLADGSCGFFFTGFQQIRERLNDFDLARVVATPAVELIKQCESEDPLEEAIAFGVLNALSQHLLASTNFTLDQATDPLGQLHMESAEHIGMVGFFPPLVKMLAGTSKRLTILEKDPKFLSRTGAFEMSEDVAALQSCDRVLITGSTLINNTLDEVLAHCASAAQTALIGPTASCLPDPLFARGIDVVGSTMVTNPKRLKGLLEAGQPWHEATAKYCITRSNYPGIDQLLHVPPDA